VQNATSEIEFRYDGKLQVLEMTGTFGYDAGVSIGSVTILGGNSPVTCILNKWLRKGFTVDIEGLKCTSI
jgi:alpha-glucosidase